MVIHATFRRLLNSRFSPNLVTKRPSVCRRGIRKDIFENYQLYGSFTPKSEIESRSNRHQTEQATGYGMHCREILCKIATKIADLRPTSVTPVFSRITERFSMRKHCYLSFQMKICDISLRTNCQAAQHLLWFL